MGYLPRSIWGYFAGQDLGGFSLDYVVEEHLGEGPFLVSNGDVLTGLDLAEVVETHRGSGDVWTREQIPSGALICEVR